MADLSDQLVEAMANRSSGARAVTLAEQLGQDALAVARALNQLARDGVLVRYGRGYYSLPGNAGATDDEEGEGETPPQPAAAPRQAAPAPSAIAALAQFDAIHGRHDAGNLLRQLRCLLEGFPADGLEVGLREEERPLLQRFASFYGADIATVLDGIENKLTALVAVAKLVGEDS